MPAVPPVPERFATLLHIVSQAVAQRTGWALSLQLIGRIIDRLRSVKWRFLRLAARIEAGRLAPRSGATAPREPDDDRPRPAPPGDPLPRTFGWLRPLIEETPQFAGMFDSLLHDPDMARLMAAAPEPMGRLLRPLCRMFGVKPPPAIALPPRRRQAPRGTPPAPPARPPLPCVRPSRRAPPLRPSVAATGGPGVSKKSG